MTILEKKQKLIVLSGVACLAALGCVVPWTDGRGWPIGYGLIFYAPSEAKHVDMPRVIIPMAVVVCTTIAAVLLTMEKTTSTTTAPNAPTVIASQENQPKISSRTQVIGTCLSLTIIGLILLVFVSSGDTKASVKGIVHFDDLTPVTGGLIQFVPEKGNVCTARIGYDGSYELTTPIGKTRIAVTGPMVRVQFGNPVTSGLTYDVKSGRGHHNIKLPK